MGTAASDGDAASRATCSSIDNQVDAKSGTVRVRAVFDNTDGASCPASSRSCAWASAKAEPALLVSERAVGTDQNKKFVMVVGADNKAVYREVTLGAQRRRPAHRHLGPEARRARRRQRPAARAPRRAASRRRSLPMDAQAEDSQAQRDRRREPDPA